MIQNNTEVVGTGIKDILDKIEKRNRIASHALAQTSNAMSLTTMGSLLYPSSEKILENSLVKLTEQFLMA